MVKSNQKNTSLTKKKMSLPSQTGYKAKSGVCLLCRASLDKEYVLCHRDRCRISKIVNSSKCASSNLIKELLMADKTRDRVKLL